MEAVIDVDGVFFNWIRHEESQDDSDHTFLKESSSDLRIFY